MIYPCFYLPSLQKLSPRPHLCVAGLPPPRLSAQGPFP